MLIPFPKLVNKYNFKPNGILHIGANEGQELDWYLDAGVDKVVFIEAIPNVYEKLKKHSESRKNNNNNIYCINACISDEDDKEVAFHVSSNNAESSSMMDFGIHKILHPDVHFIADIKLKTVTVDTLKYRGYYELNGGDLDFLNIDLQGAELMALKGMGEYLEEFKWAYIEVNKKETYRGCPLVEEIDYYMWQYGFLRIETSQWVGDTWGDAFFVKTRIKNEY